MAAWDELRARARDEGEAVALSPAFRETLDRHGALMRQAASFGARPRTFERLLSERAGIGEGELRELARGACPGRQLPALRRRQGRARAPGQDEEGESEHARRDAEPAPEACTADRTGRRGDRPSRPARRGDDARIPARTPPPFRRAAEAPARREAPGPDLSQAAYRRLRRDWQDAPRPGREGG